MTTKTLVNRLVKKIEAVKDHPKTCPCKGCELKRLCVTNVPIMNPEKISKMVH